MSVFVEIGAANTIIDENTSDTYYLFEPFRESYEALTLKYQDNPNITIYPVGLWHYATRLTLYETRKAECSSVFVPNRDIIDRYPNPERFDVIRTHFVSVQTLDSLIPTGTEIDQMTIDTQGCELEILLGARETLKSTKRVVCEVEFVELYKQQKLFDRLDEWMNHRGFKLDGYVREVFWGEDKIFGDAIYVKGE